MRAAEKLVLAGLLVATGCLNPALAAWSGFDHPGGGLCTFGSPLPRRSAAVVISGRFAMGNGRANPIYSLVFSAGERTPEITKLDLMVDEREIAHFDTVAHVPATPDSSAVVPLDTNTLGALFHATDTGKVLRVLVPAIRPAYDFDLTGFAKAADTFAACMLLNGP